MSAVIETLRKPESAQPLPLLASSNLQRIFAWRNGVGISAGEFLADVQAVADALPTARFAVNLCVDRYRFLVAFCAVALRGQTNLLPASRSAQAIGDVLAAYAGGYALGDTQLFKLDAHFHPIDDGMFAGAAAREVPSLAGNHVVAIGFTSGSTGTPKPNEKTWSSLCASTALNIQTLGFDRCAPSIIATVPAQHMYGLELSVMLPLRSDASINSGQPFFPADVAHAVAQAAQPCVLVTTPFHLRALLLEPGLKLPPIQTVVSATAALDSDLAAETERRFNTRLIELFGSTETCVIACRRTALESRWSLYPGLELQPQPDGTIVQAPYFSAPVLLQDIVELLPLHQFTLCGRNGDLLEIAGKRASLGDLNRRLLSIQGVEDAIVFQLDADASGIARVAALAVAPGLCENSILDELRRAIDPVFLPRPLRLLTSLPRNATGKIARATLLEAVAARV